MPHAIATALAPLVLAATVASAGEPDPRWSGTYSNLCVHEESGDLLGIEMTFVHPSGAPEPRLIKLTPESDGRLGFAGDADAPPFVLQPGAGDTAQITFPQASTRDEPATQPLVRRSPVWGGKQSVPVCR